MLKSITITNLGAFAGETSIALPAVCLVSGGNGEGKTSLLDIIKFFGDRGHDPDLLHGSQPEGDAVLVLDDGCQLRLRVTRRETTRWWKPADGKRWIEGRDLIDKIYRAIAYSPIRFLELDQKAQIAKFLEIAPVEVNEGAIVEAVGDADLESGLVNPQVTGLERIAAKSANLYSARRDMKRDADQLAAHAAQLEVGLRAALPDERDWGAERQKVADSLATLQAGEQAEMETLKTDFGAAKQGAVDACTEACIAIDARIHAAIRNLEHDRNEQKATARTVSADTQEVVRATANRPAAEIKAKHAPEIQRLTTELTQAQMHATTQAQIAGTKAAIEAARRESEVKAERSKALTAALDRLATLKTSLVSKFRIGGGYVEDGRIVREQDGGLVPLNRWNTADQTTFCLALGMKIGGGLVCVDHFEAYDEPHRAKVIETCRKYAEREKVQFLLAEVDPKAGPFRVADVGPLAVEGK